MKKQILSILIVALMLMSLLPTTVFAVTSTGYGVYIGGVEITDENKDDLVSAINDLAGEPVAAGTATYNPSNGILTLTNFKYTGNGYNFSRNTYAAIYSSSVDLKIAIVGENSITCEGDGSIYGIRSECSIFIRGVNPETAKLTIESGYDCLASGETIDINGVELSVVTDGVGFDVWGSDLYVSFENSVVSIESAGHGIYMNEYYVDGELEIYESNLTIASDHMAICCSNVNIGSASYVLAGDSESDADYADPMSNDSYTDPFLQVVGIQPENLSITRDNATTYYSCLADAAFDAEDGDVIKVEHDYIEYDYIILANWSSYTIDLQGHEIHFADLYWDDFGAMYYDNVGPRSLSSEEPDYGILTLTDSVGGGVIHALISVEGGLRIDSGTYGGIIAPYDTIVTGGTFLGLPQEAITIMMQDPSMSLFANMIGTKSFIHESFFDLIDNEEDARERFDSAFGVGYMPDKAYDVYVTESGYYLVALPANTSVVEAYKVTLNYGSGDEESFYAAAENFTAPDAKTIGGKLFLGWYDNAALTQPHDFTTPLTSSITLYAKYVDYEADQKKLNSAISSLNRAVDDVESALSDKADKSTLTEEIGKLADAIEAAKAYADTQDAALKKALEEADAAMNTAIAALQADVTALEEALVAANGKIDTNTTDLEALKADVTTLKTQTAEAQDAIDALDALTTVQSEDIAALKDAVSNLERAAEDAKAKILDAEKKITVLEGKVTDLEAAAADLESAVSALQTTIATKADTAVVNDAIADLQDAIDALVAVKDNYITADDALKTDLENQIAAANAALAAAKTELATKIEKADAELQAAIDALSAELDAANAKAEKLETFITVVCVIASVAFCGCGAFAAFYFLGKKKIG